MASSVSRSSATRDEILDAAERLMAERGFRAASISEICSASRFPVGSVYWHFANKNALLAAVMERASKRFFAGLPDPATLPGTARQRFDSWFAANGEMLARRSQFLRLHLSLCLLDEVDEVVTAIDRRVRGTALRLISAVLLPWVREHHPAGADEVAAELAVYVLATVDGSFIAQHADGADIGALMGRLHRHLVAEVEQAPAARA